MSRVRVVGFDLDGTLFDHRGSATTGVREFLRGLGVEPTDEIVTFWFAVEGAEFEQWRAGRITFGEQRRRRLRRVLAELGINHTDDPDDLDRLFDRYLIDYERAWRLYPDVTEVLAMLRQRGLRLGLLTNGSEDQQRRKLSVTGLDDHFDAICVSEAIGAQKPDRAAFLALARSLQVEPHSCLFIGDNPEQDVVGAIRAGMRAARIERDRAGAPGLAAVIDAALAAAADEGPEAWHL
ncbi:HAD family hydrolase [Microbacterium sp. ZW T5_56]|uniref:HAD family hydrolase n=1 Tax=Microbacterium sp. ZW T5_56 TaxID=3378081 RepID=UPI0038540B90